MTAPGEPNNLRMLRERRAWSQEHLAEVAGISVRTLQRMEAGEVGSPESRLALAAALGVDVADFRRPGPARSVEDASPGDGIGVVGDERRFRAGVLAVGLLIAVALFMILGYMFGSDMAKKKNRQAVDCADRSGQECLEPPASV